MRTINRIGAVLTIGGFGGAGLILVLLLVAPDHPGILPHWLGYVLMGGPLVGLLGAAMWQSDKALLGPWEVPRHRDDRKMDDWGR